MGFYETTTGDNAKKGEKTVTVEVNPRRSRDGRQEPLRLLRWTTAASLIALAPCQAQSAMSQTDASSPPPAAAARAQDERAYTDGPVTTVTNLQVQYGGFEPYIDWLNSTWKPTMEAFKKAGLIIDYKVFVIGVATPPVSKPDQPNMILWITYKNMAALDRGVEQEEVAKKVIGSIEVQNKARVGRNEYRKNMGVDLFREIILK